MHSLFSFFLCYFETLLTPQVTDKESDFKNYEVAQKAQLAMQQVSTKPAHNCSKSITCFPNVLSSQTNKCLQCEFPK